MYGQCKFMAQVAAAEQEEVLHSTMSKACAREKSSELVRPGYRSSRLTVLPMTSQCTTYLLQLDN